MRKELAEFEATDRRLEQEQMVRETLQRQRGVYEQQPSFNHQVNILPDHLSRFASQHLSKSYSCP